MLLGYVNLMLCFMEKLSKTTQI